MIETESSNSPSHSPIFRTSETASHAVGGDDAATFSPVNTTRAARRRMMDDTTTIRPSWRSVTAPMAIIHTKHVSAKPTRRRIGLISALVPITAAVALVSFGFLSPQASSVPDVAPVAVAAIPSAQLTPDPANAPVDNGSQLTDAAALAAGPLSADAQVKAQAAAATQVAASAGTAAQAQAEADAKAAAKNSSAGASRADYGNGANIGSPVPVPDGAFIAPVSGYVITSDFAWRIHPITGVYEFHNGVDMAVPCGTPIHASGDGAVTFAGWNTALGNYVEINHGPLSTGYGHMTRFIVKVGQQVKQGDVIGYVGATGMATGCHVHFQAINSQGQYFDPKTLLH